MSRSLVRAILLVAATALAACASDTKPADPLAVNASAPPSADLKALFASSDEAVLVRNPIVGIFRGDLRHTSTFGEYQSDAYYAAEKAAALSARPATTAARADNSPHREDPARTCNQPRAQYRPASAQKHPLYPAYGIAAEPLCVKSGRASA